MKDLTIKELMRSKEEKRILTGKINSIEDEYYKLKNEKISCAIIWYEDIKINENNLIVNFYYVRLIFNRKISIKKRQIFLVNF